jgi:HD-GYP domain-containing protein (c-di-GMP phosphodiesterase class II)
MNEQQVGRFSVPLGLAKEEIPRSARILAVVDSYDAMTSDRLYRAALSVTEAKDRVTTLRRTSI